MKNTKEYFLRIFAILLFVGASCTIFAQGPPAPPEESTSNGNKLDGNGAPIGGGLFILLGLGAAYGGKKLYDLRKEKLDE